MNRIGKFLVMIIAGMALTAFAAPAFAQSVDTSKPIPVKPAKTSKSKLEVFKGQVMNATALAITVRSQDNERLIRTFTYSDALRGHMQQILDQGGYQYGDKVTIETEPGSNVALHIKGKPSKPV